MICMYMYISYMCVYKYGYVYIYYYIYILYVCVYVYICMYIYIYTENAASKHAWHLHICGFFSLGVFEMACWSIAMQNSMTRTNKYPHIHPVIHRDMCVCIFYTNRVQQWMHALVFPMLWVFTRPVATASEPPDSSKPALLRAIRI